MKIEKVVFPGDVACDEIHLGTTKPQFDNGPLCRYMVYAARHPDPESEFGRYVQPLPGLEDAALFNRLLADGYDGLMWVVDGKVVAHIFYQMRDGELHAFSVFVGEDFRGRKWSHTMSERLVTFAAVRKITRLRISKGQLGSILGHLRSNSPHPVDVSDDGFIELRKKAA